MSSAEDCSSWSRVSGSLVTTQDSGFGSRYRCSWSRQRVGTYVDVKAISPLEFVPGVEFSPVLGERTMTNFVWFAPQPDVA